jgi:hypothetical protein
MAKPPTQKPKRVVLSRRKGLIVAALKLNAHRKIIASASAAKL